MAATFACIAGGGTAGHLLPGIAVADALVATGHSKESIHFVGGAHGPETTTVPAAGYPFTALPGRGIPREMSLTSLKAVYGIARGVLAGVGLIRRLKPGVVIVLGGYAAVPSLIGAILWRVPILIMEQNARAGAANRMAAPFARAAAVPFAETDLARSVVTGNPVRPEIMAVRRPGDTVAARLRLGLPADRTVVAVFSGSLGSRRINDAVAGLALLWRHRTDIAIHHVVGARDWDHGDEAPAPARTDQGGLVYQRVRYEENMADLLAAADVAVCRAGGSTVAELAQVGLGSVLVPLPIATRDHQTANAEVLVRAGAAVLVADADLDADRLGGELAALLAREATLASMAREAKRLAHPDAAERVAALAEDHARHG